MQSCVMKLRMQREILLAQDGLHAGTCPMERSKLIQHIDDLQNVQRLHQIHIGDGQIEPHRKLILTATHLCGA